jgi:hypothetical protein
VVGWKSNLKETQRTIGSISFRKFSLRCNVTISLKSRQTNRLVEGRLQMLQAFGERDARDGPSCPHTVEATREGRERVATRTTRLEYAEESLWLDQQLKRRSRGRDTYLDACMIPDDQSEQWGAGT